MNDRNIEDTRQPPDEPETEFCEDCGEEMAEIHDWDGVSSHRCTNVMCSSKFNAGEVAYVMANHLVEVEQDLKDAKTALKYAEARIVNLTTIRIRREDRIEELENQIEELTRSQHE